MTNRCIIDIPFPPSTNNLYANVPGHGRVKSGRYKTWKSAAGWDVKASKVEKFTGPVEIELTLERKSNRGDLDNKIKAVLDLLVDMDVLVDDKQVEVIVAKWGFVKGCRVEIMSMEAA